MGGRGSAGAGGPEPWGRRMSIEKFLSKQDVDRANAASVTDMGDIINRAFKKNVAEINGLNLSDSEKKEAVEKMAELSAAALKAAAGAVNPYSSGPARLTAAQKSGSAADKAAKARGEMAEYMRNLRDRSSANRRVSEKKAFSTAFVSAVKSGALEITVNGEKYRRANKRSGTWRKV